ncbi:hypothetical protein B0H10DRAFT_2220129 [Mycena sp. CBHHK59/15]|nr:hypothetical protein B0H10DRAFT_2220129 [Mycena sp. CBHHK59/15]
MRGIAHAAAHTTELETKALEAEKQLRAAEAALKAATDPTPSDAEANNNAADPDAGSDKKEALKEAGASARAREDREPKKPVVVSPEDVVADGSDEGSDDDEGGEDAEVDLDDLPTSLADEDGRPDSRRLPIDASEDHPEKSTTGFEYDNDTVVLGLRVYTSKESLAVVGGQLRHEMKTSLAALVNSAL